MKYNKQIQHNICHTDGTIQEIVRNELRNAGVPASKIAKLRDAAAEAAAIELQVPVPQKAKAKADSSSGSLRSRKYVSN